MCNSIYPGAIRGRQNGDGTFKQQLEISRRNYSNAITTVQKDNLVITGRLLDELTRPISHCIEASYFHGVTLRGNTGLPRRQVVLENTRIRRLTPRECWRLMGFSDDDYDRARAALISRFYNGRDRADTQLYKQAGNSIVVNVLTAILRELRSAMPYLFEDIKVGSFFSGIGAFEKALAALPQESWPAPEGGNM